MYDDPTLRNARGAKELCMGYLLKAGKGNITETAFRYSVYSPRAFNATVAGLPGYEYVKPTETIRTSRIDLPFAKNDQIRMQDGRTMTVQGAVYDVNNNKAYMTGDSRTAWIITLEGGAE